MSEQRPQRRRLNDASAGTADERGKARVRANSNHVKGAHDRSDRQYTSQESKGTRRKVLAFLDLRGNHLERVPDDVNESRLPEFFRGSIRASLLATCW